MYCNYNVTWVTSAACDLPDAPGRPSSLASDWGTHFLLIFFGAVIVYCGLGTFVKSRLPNHSDACYNNIPQRDFWFDLPSLVSQAQALCIRAQLWISGFLSDCLCGDCKTTDGVLFTVSGGARKANKHGTYESIGAPRYAARPASRRRPATCC